MCVQLVSALKTPTLLFPESAAGRTAVPLAEGGRVVDMVFTMVGTLSTQQRLKLLPAFNSG